MRTTTERYERFRVAGPPHQRHGAFQIPLTSMRIVSVIASSGAGWDHVSVSLSDRCPTWDEMCAVKRLFFYENEAVMQLHPPESEYVNNHRYCLHLWRPQAQQEIDAERADWGDEWCYGDLQSPGLIPLPQNELVGVKALGTLV